MDLQIVTAREALKINKQAAAEVKQSAVQQVQQVQQTNVGAATGGAANNVLF